MYIYIIYIYISTYIYIYIHIHIYIYIYINMCVCVHVPYAINLYQLCGFLPFEWLAVRCGHEQASNPNRNWVHVG